MREDAEDYNYFRDYDPGIGRYIESDPIGLRGGVNSYAYGVSSPLGVVDPYGLKFSYSQSGSTVTIHGSITAYGPAASDALARSWQDGINGYWNGQGHQFSFGTCKIVFDIRVSADPSSNWWFTAKDADNYVYVMGDGYRSRVWFHRYGRWSASAGAWTAAHEAGHMFNLGDDYKDVNGISVPLPGHKGHMMGDYGAPVAQHEIDDIMRQLECRCGGK